MFVGAIRPLSARACQDPRLPAVGLTTDVARKGNLEVPIEQAQCGGIMPSGVGWTLEKGSRGAPPPSPPSAETSNASLEIGISFSVFLPG